MSSRSYENLPFGSQTVSAPKDHVADPGGGGTEAEVLDIKLEGRHFHSVNATHLAVPSFAQ
jgi:hypothetical protein